MKKILIALATVITLVACKKTMIIVIPIIAVTSLQKLL